MTNPMQSAFQEFHQKPLKQKRDPRYGKLIAENLLSTIKSGNSNYFSLRNSRIEANRLFAKGKQPMAEYLDYLGIDGKNAYVNLDMKSPSIAPKYIRRIIQRFMEREERPTVDAVDDISKNRKIRERDEAEYRMRMMPEIAEFSQMGGMNLEEPDAFVPEDEDDLELWDTTEHRLGEEIDFEAGIWSVLTDNDIKVIKKRSLSDIAIAGFSVLQPYLDANKHIKIRFVTPEHTVYTHFRYDDGRDCALLGELQKMKVSDFRMLYPGVDEKKVFDYAKKSNQNPSVNMTWTDEYRNWLYRPYDDVLIEVLIFRMKTVETDINIKKVDSRGRLVLESRDEYPKELGKDKELIAKPTEVVYCGTLVVGASEMVEWKLAENMIKPHHALQEVFLDYCIVFPENEEMENVPLVEAMIPNIRRMALLELKIQQLIAKLKADGVAINPKRLMDVDLGTGKKYTALEVTAIWEQMGVLYYDDIGEDGETRKDPPIKPLEFQGSIQKLAGLQQLFSWYEGRLMSDIGSNEAVDGIGVNDRKGLGVMQNQINSSNRANEFIYNAWITLLEGLAKRVAVLLWYNIVCGPNKYTKMDKKAVSDMVFDLSISMLPTDQDIQYIETIVATALTAKTLTFEEAFKIRRLARVSIKNAERYLAKCDKRRTEKEMQLAQNAAAANAEQQMASNQQTHQNQIQLEQQKGQIKIDQQTVANEGSNSKQLGQMIQDLIKESMATGKDIPAFMLPIVQAYFQNLQGNQQNQIMQGQMTSQGLQMQQLQQQAQMAGMMQQ